MNYLINYADLKYIQAQKINTYSAKRLNCFDKIYQFSPKDICPQFVALNKELFSYKRGNGLWLWKPYFIREVMKEAKNGDTIFYCDSGSLFIRKPDYVYNNLSEDNPMFCCDIPLIESCFTKPICFEKMNCKGSLFFDTNQIIATYFCLYVCDKTRRFVDEWLNYCCDIELMKPEGTINLTEKKYNSFVAHREDQSIFSLLCKKYGFLPHKDISQRGNDQKSYYSPYYTYRETVHKEDSCCKTILYLHKSPKLGIVFFSKLIIKKIVHFIKTHKSK